MSLDPEFVSQLVEARCAPCFPAQLRQLAVEIGKRALTLLFPQLAGYPASSDHHEVELEVLELRAQIRRFLNQVKDRYPQSDSQSFQAVDAFISKLIPIHQALMEDAEAIFHADPAAESVDEVILSYPGLLATAYYRVAHELLKVGIPLLPRLLCQEAHHQTGIDINPGAKIGRRFSIDHGTGVVIGETCVIGNGVKLFQGVTLGALAVDRTLRHSKRHPTLGDNVVVYANATILGGDTVIGNDSIIGGNAWITSSVPPFSMVNRQSSVRPRTGAGEEFLDFMI
jgi:serine O-acetyltransferase